MAGPWEQYQAQSKSEPSGPWETFATPAAPAAPEGGIIPRPIRQATTWANQAIAGVPDAVLNTPTNVWNLAKAGFGTAANLAGRGDLAPEMTPNPNYVTRAFEAVKGIEPGMEPTSVPGRLAKAAVQGGTVGLMAPAQSIGQAALNSGISGASGVLGQGTTEATGKPLLGAAVNMAAVPALSAGVNAMREASIKAKAQNELRDQTLNEARGLGLVTPPSATGGNWFTRRLESMAGKAATGQEMSVSNQKAGNEAAKLEIGLPPNNAISMSSLDKRRDVLAAPYNEVRALNKQAGQDLKDLQDARRLANLNYRHYDSSQDPKALIEAQKYSAQAESLEMQLEGYARAAMKPGLVQELRDARQAIAKTYDVERALNTATGDVSLPILGKMVDKGGPMTGRLATLGKFQQAFPAYAREGATIPTPGVSKSEALAATMFGLGGYGAAGPAGIALAALPLASGPVRSMLSTSPFQGAPGYAAANLPAVSDPYLRAILSTQGMLK